MKILLLLYTALIFSVAGCVSEDADNNKEAMTVGSDSDEYGCIGSAGYSWCERTQQCERPWELAEQAGFENTREGFQEYCASLEP